MVKVVFVVFIIVITFLVWKSPFKIKIFIISDSLREKLGPSTICRLSLCTQKPCQTAANAHQTPDASQQAYWLQVALRMQYWMHFMIFLFIQILWMPFTNSHHLRKKYMCWYIIYFSELTVFVHECANMGYILDGLADTFNVQHAGAFNAHLSAYVLRGNTCQKLKKK